MINDSHLLKVEKMDQLLMDDFITKMSKDELHCHIRHCLVRPELYLFNLLCNLCKDFQPNDFIPFISEIYSFFLVVQCPTPTPTPTSTFEENYFIKLVRIMIFDGLQKKTSLIEDNKLLLQLSKIYHLIISRCIPQVVIIPSIKEIDNLKDSQVLVGDCLSGWIGQFFLILKMGLSSRMSSHWSSLIAWINYFGFLLIHREPHLLLARLIPFFLGVWDLLLIELESYVNAGGITSSKTQFPHCATIFLLKSVEHQLTTLMEIPEAERYTSLLIDALERKKKIESSLTSIKEKLLTATATKKRPLLDIENDNNNEEDIKDDDIIKRTCDERLRERKKDSLIDITHLPINSISRLLLLSLISLNPLQMEMLPSTLDKWRPSIGGLAALENNNSDQDDDSDSDSDHGDHEETIVQDPRMMMMTMMQDSSDNQEEQEEESISPQVHFRRLLFTTLHTIFPHPSKIRWMHTKSLIRLAILLENGSNGGDGEFTSLIIQYTLRSSSTGNWSKEGILMMNDDEESIGGPDELLYFLGSSYCKSHGGAGAGAGAGGVFSIDYKMIWTDHLIPFINDKINTTSLPSNTLWPLWLGRLLKEGPPGFCEWNDENPLRSFVISLFMATENVSTITDPLSYYEGLIDFLIGDGYGLLSIISIRLLVLEDLLSMLIDCGGGGGNASSIKYLTNIVFRRRLIDAINGMSYLPAKLSLIIDDHLREGIEGITENDVNCSGILEFYCRRAFLYNNLLLEGLFRKTINNSFCLQFLIGQFPIIIPLLQESTSLLISSIIEGMLKFNCELLGKFLEPSIRINLLKNKEISLEGVLDFLVERKGFSIQSTKLIIELLMRDHLGDFSALSNDDNALKNFDSNVLKLRMRNQYILGIYLEISSVENEGDKVSIATLLARILQTLKQTAKASLPLEVKGLFKALHYPLEELGSSNIRIKEIIDVIGIVISMQNLFKPELIKEGMMEILEDIGRELPPNYMRTLMQALTQHPHTMISSILAILNRMIRLSTRLPWDSSRNWKGFVRLIGMLGRSSFPLISILPSEQVNNLLMEVDYVDGSGDSGFKNAFLSYQKEKNMN